MGEEKGGEGMRGKSRGCLTVGSHTHVGNPEEYRDCRTDQIGGDGNTDVWPGRQTPSPRHCYRRAPCLTVVRRSDKARMPTQQVSANQRACYTSNKISSSRLSTKHTSHHHVITNIIIIIIIVKVVR